MARITVEDCLKRVPNRFLIVNMAAKRVRQIREGSEYLVSSPKNEDIVVALREIAAGKIQLAPEGGKVEEPVEEAAAPAEAATVEADVKETAPKADAKEAAPEAEADDAGVESKST